MKSTRLFVLSFALAMAVLAVAYYALFRYQFGAPILASYDVENWARLKNRISDRTPGHRVLVAGDSNVLFGFDSELAEKSLGRPVINMGLHAGLPIDWILSMAVRNARAGDVVVLPLWWGYYAFDYREPNDWFVDQMVAWDGRYYDALPPLRKLQYVSAVSVPALYRNIVAKEDSARLLKEHPWRKLDDEATAMKKWDEVAAQTKEFSYSYLNMTGHGDMRNTCESNVAPITSQYDVPADGKIHPASLRFVLDFVATMRARGVAVYVFPPVMLDDDYTRNPVFQRAIHTLWSGLQKAGLETVGAPFDYTFPKSAFFNTGLHLNCGSAPERTNRMVRALRQRLGAPAGAQNDG